MKKIIMNFFGLFLRIFKLKIKFSKKIQIKNPFFISKNINNNSKMQEKNPKNKSKK